MLALLVDEWRQSRENQRLAKEAIAAMRNELSANRSVLAWKFSMLHDAYVQLNANPDNLSAVLARRVNKQVPLTDAGWQMTTQTGALRLLTPEQRNLYALAYAGQEAYWEIATQEMAQWTSLAGLGTPRTASDREERTNRIRLWQLWAVRVAGRGCNTAARLEHALNPSLKLPFADATARVSAGACDVYTPALPPAEMYKALGIPEPQAISDIQAL